MMVVPSILLHWNAVLLDSIVHVLWRSAYGVMIGKRIEQVSLGSIHTDIQKTRCEEEDDEE